MLTGTTDLSGNELATTTTGDTSGEHSSADAMFTDLTDLAANTGDQSAVRISQLTTYIAQGQTFFDQGKASNNTTMMKYGIYIQRKGTELMNRLESGDTLVNDMVPNYLAQFSGYLAQLQTLENNALSTPTDTPSDTSTSTDTSGQETIPNTPAE